MGFGEQQTLGPQQELRTQLAQAPHQHSVEQTWARESALLSLELAWRPVGRNCPYWEGPAELRLESPLLGRPLELQELEQFVVVLGELAGLAPGLGLRPLE